MFTSLFIFLINSHTHPLILSVSVFHHQKINESMNLCVHYEASTSGFLRGKKKLYLCQFHIPCCSSCVYFRHVSLHLLHFIVLWDKSKFRKQISGSATHYFLEWNHLSCFLPHLFPLFFTPFWYLWTIIIKQNKKVNTTQETREIKYHDWHCKTPNNLNMPLLHGMQCLVCDWNWRPT